MMLHQRKVKLVVGHQINVTHYQKKKLLIPVSL